MSLGETDAKRPPILRPNYGTAMYHLGAIDVGASKWTHTFAIPWLRPKMEAIPRPLCAGQVSECKNVSQLIETIDNQRQESFRRIMNYTTSFQKLIKTTNNHKMNKPATRSRRGAIDIIGQISKSLFGIATTHDCEILAQHIKKIEETTSLQSEYIHKHESLTNSFMKTTGKRLRNVEHAMNMNHENIVTLQKNIGLLEDTYRRQFKFEVEISQRLNLLFTVLQILVYDLNQLVGMEALAMNFMLASQTLLDGYLPLAIIDPDQIQMVLDHVATELKNSDHFSGFRIAYENPNYYFQVKDILYSSSEEYLYLSIFIPLYSELSYFEIFNVITIPMSLNGTHSNTTRIRPNHQYLGVSVDEKNYLEFDHDFLSGCQGRELKVCKGTKSMRSTEYLSCLMALYLDLPKQIVEKCEIEFEIDGLFEGAIDLTDNLYLVSSRDDTWTLSCWDKPRQTIQSCQYCLLKIGCGCALTSSSFTIAPRITGCVDRKEDVTYLHPFNLAAFYTLFPDNKTFISGLQTFTRMPQFPIPHLAPIKGNWETINQNEKKLALDFKELIKKNEENGKVFASKVDALGAEFATLPTPWTVSTVISIPGIISIVSLLLSLYLVVRTHCCMMSLVPTMNTLPTAKAYLIISNESFTIRSAIAKSGNTTIVLGEQGVSHDSILLILIGVLVAYVALRNLLSDLWKLRKLFGYTTGKSMSNVVLRISNERTCLDLFLMPLADSPFLYCMTEVPNLLDVQIVHGSICSHLLKLTWVNVELVNFKMGERMKLPSQVPLHLWEMPALREILASKYNTVVYLEHGGLLSPILIDSRPEEEFGI